MSAVDPYDLPVLPIHETEWMTEAACRGRPTEWFFPRARDETYYRLARKLCARCPVREDCLTFADTLNEQEFGMYGGLTPDQRRNRRRGIVGFCEWCGEEFLPGKGRFCSTGCRTEQRMSRVRAREAAS